MKAQTLAKLVVLSVLTASVTLAEELCVSTNHQGCFSSVQAAVDAAQEGDRIIIRPGVYAEAVVIDGKGLWLSA